MEWVFAAFIQLSLSTLSCPGRNCCPRKTLFLTKMVTKTKAKFIHSLHTLKSRVKGLTSLLVLYLPKKITDLKTLDEVALYAARRQYKKFCFLEIGVFKGDNAVSIAGKLISIGIPVKYIGFDLFDDIDYLKTTYPEDYKNIILRNTLTLSLSREAIPMQMWLKSFPLCSVQAIMN